MLIAAAALLPLALSPIVGATSAYAQADASTDDSLMEDLMGEGASLYRLECARCHGRNGEGQLYDHGAAPRLAGNAARLAVRKVAVQVIRGGSYMPPFGSLTDRELAAVVTYVRNAFGNDYGPATVDEIAQIRAE